MIYIPEKIKVGFNKRMDTYTGKLAYITYIDFDGKLKREGSFESWRDKKINTEEFLNIPRSGFVLNKGAGGKGYGYNFSGRDICARIYDPRGFEFEITIENLFIILEYENSIKGKGLEGEYVYCWIDDSQKLFLMPTSHPDYQKGLDQTKEKSEFKKVEELVIGNVYRKKSEVNYVYIGKYKCFDSEGLFYSGNHHIFYNNNERCYVKVPDYKNMFETGKIHKNKDVLIHNFEKSNMIYNESKAYKKYTLEEFKKMLKEHEFKGVFKIYTIRDFKDNTSRPDSLTKISFMNDLIYIKYNLSYYGSAIREECFDINNFFETARPYYKLNKFNLTIN